MSKHLLPRYERREYRLQVRLAEYERRAFQSAAEQEAMSVSQWTRWAARQWAREHHPRLFHKMWVEEKQKHDERQSLLHR